MQLWECITIKGFVLARGYKANNKTFLTFRADIGICKIELANPQSALKIAPTAHKIRYLENPKPK